MDWVAMKKKSLLWISKYRYVLLVVAAGMVLMLLPTGESKSNQTTASSQETQSRQEEDINTRLAQILGQISGVGEVRVLLTVAAGEEILYQTDDQISENQTRIETVLITDSDRAQTGLVRQVKPPVYRGAVVVCKGADKASVRLAVVEAVSSLTGLGADQISVLKMK